MGDQMLGMITAGPYSVAHDSALNKAYVAVIREGQRFPPGLRLARRLRRDASNLRSAEENRVAIPMAMH